MSFKADVTINPCKFLRHLNGGNIFWMYVGVLERFRFNSEEETARFKSLSNTRANVLDEIFSVVFHNLSPNITDLRHCFNTSIKFV